MARLRRLRPDDRSTEGEWNLAGPLTLGRDPECDVVLPGDVASREHARLTPTAEGVVLEDLDSANGTWVGQCRVQRHVLRPGEMFRVGASWFLVETQTPVTPSPSKRRSFSPLLLGCLGLLALGAGLAVIVVGIVVWSRSRPEPTADSAPMPRAGREAAPEVTPLPEPPASGREPSRSVPPADLDLLELTLAIATDPDPRTCAAMPTDWAPPDLSVRIAARVSEAGTFVFEDEAEGRHLEGRGTWTGETLTLEGTWQARRSTGDGEQVDQGSFSGGGRLILGTWFGGRLQARFSSTHRAPTGPTSCQETIHNPYSTITHLTW